MSFNRVLTGFFPLWIGLLPFFLGGGGEGGLRQKRSFNRVLRGF